VSGAPPVVVESLDHHYGAGALRRQILFDVSATIPAGEIIIVTGPSGSGKTTLLTLVGALRAAQSGSVRVLGQELKDARDATLEQVRRRIGFIFQQHNLLAALTATENVELGLRATGSFTRSELRRRARAMLEAVGLESHTDSAWRSPVRWSATRRSCSRTNPRRPSTGRRAARSSIACSRSQGNRARPS
jgi:putative ABC transport system ATP-binding protein